MGLEGASLSFMDFVLNTLRRRLKPFPRLSSSVRALRTLVHFGPWRVVPQFLIRWFRPVICNLDANKESLLGTLDADAIAEEIRFNSCAIAGVLPSEFLSRLRTITDRLPRDHYQGMHYLNEDVLHLSNDPAIKDVLRSYFKCEPELLESTLLVTRSSKTRCDSQSVFHIDYAGWDSLNVLVYLTDVTEQSSPHIVARGSHRNVGLRDAIRISIDSDEALRRFGSSITVITGTAGTLFFENTEAFHRRENSDERRVMLNLLYASHRSWLSHGRMSRAHIERSAKRIAAVGDCSLHSNG